MNRGARALEFSLSLSYCEDKAEQTFCFSYICLFLHGEADTTYVWQAPNGIMGFDQTAQLLSEHW